MPTVLLNPHRTAGFAAAPLLDAPLAVHRRLPDYKPTPLRPLPSIAARLRVAEVAVKDESDRLGLPAYKVLGAAWAVYRLVTQRLGRAPEPWRTVGDLREQVRPLLPLRLVTATDGNHGRGVARVASWLGFGAEIYVPAGTAEARVAGISSEGAEVIVVPGTYDDTVARAAAAAGGENCALLVQDHGWPGYEEIPAWVAEGYQTIFSEIEADLQSRRRPGFDVVMVQIGVGTLASAAVRHYRRTGDAPRPALIGVEPVRAACALESVAAGAPVMLSVGAEASIMAGLNCGTPSSAAWPSLLHGMDAFAAVEDERAREAMRLLARAGVVSGESGAAGLAGLLELMEGRQSEGTRAALGIGPASRVLLLCTEGATDPRGYEAIMRR
jgi:diaminopropionate ammonia-lyase